ncbi:HET-domain-containing protein [Lojkania enalia]|uniref:HET-domain-containing protein n=1 Tax=Lojkania enalia TaxID=147567 RepID=A0A9P4N8U8_9PLEO|nr:HET-domain-containing protein [Didymosphaeria enalia]
MMHVTEEKARSVLDDRPDLWTRLIRIFAYLNFLGIYRRLRRKPLYYELPRPDSIRLVQLHAGKPGEEIKCSLETRSLDKNIPSYEALSYVWGSKDSTKRITCIGHGQTRITQNLCNALERVRDCKRSKRIWCDQICVWQDNDADKSHQVRQMSKIYSKASRVLVWLGQDDSHNADKAFAVLHALVNEHEGADSATLGQTNMAFSTLGITSMPPVKSELWENVMAFFTNTWFLRMWVIQEIALARRATVIWGASELDWEVIASAVDAIRSLPYLHTMFESRQFQNAYFMRHLRSLLNSDLKYTHPFLHLLDWSRSFDVTCAEDKVYGLLGLPTRDTIPRCNKGTVFLEPQYDQPAAHVYTEVARKIMTLDERIDVLSFTVHKDDKPEMDLPSWVPNWNSKTIIYPFSGFGARNEHRAGLSRKLQILPTEETKFLSLKGVAVDRVAEALPPAPFTTILDAGDVFKKIIGWYIEHGGSAALLATTMTGGRDTNGSLAKDAQQHLADFCAFMQDLKPGWIKEAWPDEAAALIELANRDGDEDKAKEVIWRFTCHRSAFVTESGALGLGPGAVRRGDQVVVLWGGQVPVVVRRQEGGWYKFVGECFAKGIMDGEVEKKLDGLEGCSEQVFEFH